MRNVIFAAPFPLENTIRFIRAVARLPDVRLLGIWQKPPTGEDARMFKDITLIQDGMDAGQILAATHKLAHHYGPIHRLLGILEPLQVQLGQVREAMGIVGPTSRIAELFREKAAMKDELRKHGLPCARHKLITNQDEAAAFAEEVGFPLVLKPPAGMGCKATWRIDGPDDLRAAVAALHASPARPCLAEEFLLGREYSFETIVIGGEVKFTSLTRYYPTPLEVMENPWIKWSVVLPRDMHTEEFDGVHELGTKTVQALGLRTGMTHMEWFRKNDGTLAIGEIAARPPGAQIVLANGFAHDIDMYGVWARAVVDEAFDGPWERKYAVGTAFLRGIGRGRVVSVSGAEEVQKKIGHLVVKAQLPTRGEPRADSYEGEGYVVVRHPDTEVVKAAIKTVIETISVQYG